MTCMVPRKELNHWGKRDKVTRLTSDPALQYRPQQISIRVILMPILFILFAAFLFSMGEKNICFTWALTFGPGQVVHMNYQDLEYEQGAMKKREKSYSQSKTISQKMLGRKFSLSLRCLLLHHTVIWSSVGLKILIVAWNNTESEILWKLDVFSHTEFAVFERLL